MMAQCAPLIETLDKLVTVYRHLLDVIRREHEILLNMDRERLREINLSKEKMVFKVKDLETHWMNQARVLADVLKMEEQNPTLLALANQVQGDSGKRLQNIRSVLNMLVQRAVEMNKKNEALTQSALVHINGAMGAIANTLKENPTYKPGGDMRGDGEGASGRLITKAV